MQNTMQVAAGTAGKIAGNNAVGNGAGSQSDTRGAESRNGFRRWAGQHKILAFTLGGERFGIEIGAIKEIIEYRALTAVPLTPDTISGVLNLRGDVVPVISLARRLGLEPAPVGKRTCILVIEAREGEFSLDLGIVVDMVNEVVDVEGADIEPAPAFGTSIPADYIGGMLRREEDFTALLALERVLAIPELMVPATRLNA